MKSINKEYTDFLQDMKLDVTFSKGKYTIVDKIAQEGIILSSGDDEEYEIDNFAFINGEQVFGQAASDNIFDAINYLEDVLNIGGTPPMKHETDVATVADDGRSTITDMITEQDFELQTTARNTLLMMQKTDPDYIKYRVVKKARAGKPEVKVPYVDGQYMTRALNFAFGFDWSFAVEESRTEGEYVTVLGSLVVNMDGVSIRKEQWGSQQLRQGMEFGDGLKAATTDALKKCASMFGIAADVYAGEV